MQTPRFLAIARIVRAQGRRGEVTAEILTDFPERFQKLKTILVARSEAVENAAPREYCLESAWQHKGRIVLKLAGIDTISQAETLRGHEVLIPYDERVPLPGDTYYWQELEGCRVVAGPLGERVEVGTVTEVEAAPGVPLLHVRGAGPGEVLIPFVQDICREIDPAAKLIVIEPPEGLLELNA